MSTKVDEKKTLYDSRLDRDTAMTLAADEYTRFARALADLSDPEWQAPTSCPGWTVRDIAGHTLGMAEFAASLPEMARQLMSAGRAAKKSGKPELDEPSLPEPDMSRYDNLGDGTIES